MKIKTQLTLLILCIVAIPFAAIITLPFYHIMASPQRYLLKDYNNFRKLEEFQLAESDWESIKKKLEELPPNLETSIIYEGNVVISNIPELKTGTPLDFDTIQNLISSTSESYNYRIQSPLSYKGGFIHPSDEHNMLMITRAKTNYAKRKHTINRIYIPLFVIIVLLEMIIILMIVRLSKTISTSITLLEEATQKIADGELDTKIEKPKTGKNANEITSLAESLEKMRVSLKDDASRRSKFIMGISHDLRTPVALIKGYSEAITDGVVADENSIRKSASIIQTKADQLENMINDLINYVKLNNSEWLQKLDPVLIEPFITTFATNAFLTAEVYKRNVETSIEIDKQIKIPMDQALISRALENILSNAFRYTNDGDSISIKGSNDKSNVYITIADTGKGISENDLEHIYDLFYRATNSRRESGMGIGLSTVKTIIDSHGWKIDVSSKLNEGTAFTIIIPISEESTC